MQIRVAARRVADAADVSTSNATNARLDPVLGKPRYTVVCRRLRSAFFNSADLPFEMEVQPQSLALLVTSLPI